MSAANGNGSAHDAAVATQDNAPGRTPEQQAYLDAVAVEAEQAVTTVEDMIAGWEASLAGRKAEAERARAEAENGRI